MKDEWIIRFRPEGPGPADTAIRIRQLLKHALRTLNLRAVSVAIAPAMAAATSVKPRGAAGRPSGRSRSRTSPRGAGNAAGEMAVVDHE